MVTGPPGSGKSSVTTALHDRLGSAGVPNAMIEVDELERSYPPLPPPVVFDNLRVVAAAYRDAGYPLVFITATVDGESYLRRLRSALPGVDLFVVRLDAEVDTLRLRITEREPASWHGLVELLDSASTLAATMRELDGVDLTLLTQSRDPASVADELLRHLGLDGLPAPGPAPDAPTG
ncbi:hypothetical protein D7316_01200 [Gordonia insulae]|uniref:Uncharacterized protein n=1 Tax=Gordonia insulae TaxID=2420509 RepID=A0A3G8JHW1_9ACTN|nr:hypothetical protein D7316_01200 [Gordonia insulae]